jgi:small neutral amino acid transporter SnatA (MarC family)
MKIMKLASIVSGIVLALYALFLLVWLWGESVSWETFIKTSITAGVIVVVTMGLALIYREYVEEKSMKEEKYLD